MQKATPPRLRKVAPAFDASSKRYDESSPKLRKHVFTRTLPQTERHPAPRYCSPAATRVNSVRGNRRVSPAAADCQHEATVDSAVFYFCCCAMCRHHAARRSAASRFYYAATIRFLFVFRHFFFIPHFVIITHYRVFFVASDAAAATPTTRCRHADIPFFTSRPPSFRYFFSRYALPFAFRFFFRHF